MAQDDIHDEEDDTPGFAAVTATFVFVLIDERWRCELVLNRYGRGQTFIPLEVALA